MRFTKIISSIYNWLARGFGQIFLLFAIIAVILILLELVFYQLRKLTAAAQRDKKRAAGTKRVAVITGASSGLGRAYARLLDRKEKNLDEIWLIARREERLNYLAGELKHPAKVLPMDLTDPELMKMFREFAEDEKPVVTWLINCAGFGKIGTWKTISMKDAVRMIDLNDKAAVVITQMLIPFMAAGSHILEICSTAAFQPLQYMNLYAASKAFLYNYSRALRTELMPDGISVTAVCPYWIKDTEFIPIAQNRKGKKKSAGVRSFPLSSQVKTAASLSFRAGRMRLSVSTPNPVCFFHRIFSKLIPREVLIAIWGLLRRA